MKKWFFVVGLVVLVGLVLMLNYKLKQPDTQNPLGNQHAAPKLIDTILPSKLSGRTPEMSAKKNIVVLLVDQDCSFCKTAMVRLVRDADFLISFCFVLINVQPDEIKWPEYLWEGRLCLDTIQDRNGEWMKHFRHPQTPTYLIYRDGRLLDRLTGLQSTRTILKIIDDEGQEESAVDQAGGQK